MIHTKYRPNALADVVGQEAAVKSLQAALKRKDIPHAFLFLGPSGVGKTTLARLIAKELGIPSNNVTEFDGATATGIDDAKSIKDLVSVHMLGADKRRMLIMDEVHSLSKKAWESWLKFIEEPPAHLFIALCTTEPSKVPATIRTRCHTYTLQSVASSTIYGLLKAIAKKEKIAADEDVLGYIAESASGSVRQALVYLSQCAECADDLTRAKAVVSKATLEGEASNADIARLLIKGESNWGAYMAALRKMEEFEAESIRIVTVLYVSSVMRGQQKTTPMLLRCASILDAFESPYNSSDKFAPLLLSLARVLLSD